MRGLFVSGLGPGPALVHFTIHMLTASIACALQRLVHERVSVKQKVRTVPLLAHHLHLLI